MDCNMPIMDGFEATRELKYKMERGEIKNIPIVGLTAYAGQKVEQDCYRAGMDAICNYIYIYIYINVGRL